MLAFKNEVLTRSGASPRCERTVVPADLRADWPAELEKAGFSPARQTAWLAEGLMLYLTASQAAGVLSAVSRLPAPASQLSFEHGPIATNDLLTQAQTMPAMSQYTAMWKGGLAQDAPGWLTRHGWRPQLPDLAAVAASYGRDTSGSAAGSFLTAERAG